MSEITHKYRVMIPYREPTYEVRRGRPRKKPYLAWYMVTAKNKAEAIDNALMLFEKDASNSNVHWVRVPIRKRIKAEPL